MAAALRYSSREHRRQPERIDPVVREAWGPLLDPLGNVPICLGTSAQLTLLPFDIKTEWQPELPVFEAPSAIWPWYLHHHRFVNGEHLYMDPDENSPHFGDVMGATTAIKLLTSAGASYKLFPERLASSAVLNSRSAILFGVPYKSEAILKLLQTGNFQFVYDAKLRDVSIQLNAPGKSAKVFAPRRDERQDRVESFSLITVTSVDLGGGRTGRMLAFSGDPSAGAAAAVEYFSSPVHLTELRRRLKADGYAGFPPAYQVLLRCKLDSNLPTAYSLEEISVPRKW